MRNSQRGLSLMGLIFMLFVLVVVGIFAMKLVPSFLEYRAAKSAIESIAAQNPGTPNEVRRAFDAHAAIDDINSVKSADLEIGKEGKQVVIGFAYRKEIPLWGEAGGVYINYAARTGEQ